MRDIRDGRDCTGKAAAVPPLRKLMSLPARSGKDGVGRQLMTQPDASLDFSENQTRGCTMTTPRSNLPALPTLLAEWLSKILYRLGAEPSPEPPDTLDE